MKASDIRSSFIRYFERQGHLHLPSSSLVPEDDPTLMFANAGMVQFKRVFVGEAERPAPRAVTSQKCLRVSGKHNDLEEVGRTARHHTFFEMLGNFSFGDYFKRDAIAFGWEFVTSELGLEPGRLWATVHYTDDEAAELWPRLTGIPPERVLRLGDKDNFWQMGETGPCGPCSEIHYDMRPSGATTDLTPEQFNELGEADEFMEIWNLVFMQFERSADGDAPLPAPSIDTGAGLERIAAIMQGTRTNYHTDLFLPIISAAEEIVGREYSLELKDWEAGLPFRVLADHARAVAFMLADGVFPSNEGRGYVLRRILRRAGRYAWLLGRREPTLDRLVSVVADLMSDTYPQLAHRRDHLVRTTRSEEERFLATIDAGMGRFDELAPAGGKGTIAGREVFRLYDTYGFPLDLTQLMAAERGYDVDTGGFEDALEEQRRRSREDRAAGAEGEELSEAVILAARSLTVDGEQEFVGYDRLAVESSVLAGRAVDGAHALMLETNPFYSEAGGQVSDHGFVSGDGWELEVESVVRNDRGQAVLVGELRSGYLSDEPGEMVRATVDERARRDTERNHTATHLLHAALRAELGDHVQQAGSLVAPDRLRFDFTHTGPITPDEREAIEEAVNRGVWDNVPLEIGERDYREALAAGAMALFGEKYGERVRVVSVPGVSLELCGGCHVRSTGQIGLFQIVSETGVAAGIRRIEAVTGPAAYRRVRETEGLVAGLAAALRAPPTELPRRLETLLEEKATLEKRLDQQHGRDASAVVEDIIQAAEELGAGGKLVAGAVDLPAGSDVAAFGDLLRAELGSGAAVVHVSSGETDRGAFLAVVTDDWIGRGLKAGDLVAAASRATGSGGGGRPHLARGGVGDSASVDVAIAAAVKLALEAGESAGAS
ncbi:MAG: alanine--tRNA ligase [marine benthic group bacterium]|nr:alanine--tRNA ligase [Candidatus Benthicola marisminoris]